MRNLTHAFRSIKCGSAERFRFHFHSNKFEREEIDKLHLNCDYCSFVWLFCEAKKSGWESL